MATIKVQDTGESDDRLLAPTAPHDDFSFDQLTHSYNYRVTSEWTRLYVRLLIKQLRTTPRPRRVLNIGCGHGICHSAQLTRAVGREVDESWGIEPDPSANPDPDLFPNFQTASMETAKLPENHFDLAYSYMVIEHVATPDVFFESVAKCLKPGGTHMFITVNGRHYFTRCAKFFHRAGIDELVLRALRGKKVDEYHYPVQYRCNTREEIDALAARTGFEPPEYVYVEEDGPKPYFPLPIRPIWWLLAKKRDLVRRQDNLLTMICRMRKRS